MLSLSSAFINGTQSDIIYLFESAWEVTNNILRLCFEKYETFVHKSDLVVQNS